MKDNKLLICKDFPFILSGLFMSLDFFSYFNLFFMLIIVIFSNFVWKNKMNMFLMNFMKELENSVPVSKFFNNKIFMMMMFFFIFFINFLSLFPHIFSLWSLMNFTLTISLSFWLSMIFVNLVYCLKAFLIHLTPLSTPIALMSFMVIIEIVSQIIRPLTLLVRLGTNLTTGHLLLGLISFLSLFSIFAQIPLFLLEMMVAVVQSYVFILLISLYFNE